MNTRDHLTYGRFVNNLKNRKKHIKVSEVLCIDDLECNKREESIFYTFKAFHINILILYHTVILTGHY